MTVIYRKRSLPLITRLIAALALCAVSAADLPAQERTDRPVQDPVQAARARWSPQRAVSPVGDRESASGASRAVQPKGGEGSPAVHRKRAGVVTQATRFRPAANEQRKGAVRRAGHAVPSPPPAGGTVVHEEIPPGAIVDGGVIYEGPVHEGEVYGGEVYEGPIVDGSCDAAGVSCGCEGAGCDAIGCDALGSCGPDCGCSLCGEVSGGRAWRPAITLSLPQDGWVSFEALHLWTDGMDLPPLVTSSPAGTAQADAGVLTRSTTSVLFGGDDVLTDAFDGGRLRFGFWLDRCHTVGLGGEYFELDQETETFSASSTGNPILARPFFNTLTGREDAELVAFNNEDDIQLTGDVTASAYSELASGSAYVRWLRSCSEGCRDWLFCGRRGHYCTRSEFRVGYRFMDLDEGVRVTEQMTNSVLPTRGRFTIVDSFETENLFNGVDLAWSNRLVRGYWSLESLVRLGVGNTRQTVRIAGQTTIIDQTDLNNPTTENYDAGVLALSTNSGEHEQDEFSVLPEINVTLGYQLTDHLKATFGYTGIYWSNVVRPGHHVPTMINPDFLPPAIDSQGDARPLFAFDTTDYWAHGLTYGLEYRW